MMVGDGGGAWWSELGNDVDNEAGSESLETAPISGGTRANPKFSGKGASTLPNAVKRPAIPIVAIIGRPNVGKSMIANRVR
jgi:ribosome biogenesis GTPase A